MTRNLVPRRPGLGLAKLATGAWIVAVALPFAAIAAAPDSASAGDGPVAPPARTSTIDVYGSDPCPASVGGEIVVCAHHPESDRYRLPNAFRGRKAAASPAANAWGNKVQTIESASRTNAGLPDTCSAVGTGGQSGCYHQMLQQARSQRQADKSEAGSPP